MESFNALKRRFDDDVVERVPPIRPLSSLKAATSSAIGEDEEGEAQGERERGSIAEHRILRLVRLPRGMKTKDEEMGLSGCLDCVFGRRWLT